MPAIFCVWPKHNEILTPHAKKATCSSYPYLPYLVYTALSCVYDRYMVSVRRILEYKGKFLFNVALRLIIYCPVLFTRFFFVPRQCGPNKLNWAVHEVAINKKSRDRDQFVSSGHMSGILCSVEVNRKKKTQQGKRIENSCDLSFLP